jgi:hypothetical protein
MISLEAFVATPSNTHELMAWLATNLYGCPLVFDTKPVRVGIKKITLTDPYGLHESREIEVPVYSDRETFVPYSILGSKSKSGVSLEGPELPIEDFTNWAELPADTGEIYYEVKPGIMIDPDNATLLNHGTEQDWTSEPLEI